MPQCGVELFDLRQVKLAHLRLIGKHQRLIQLLRVLRRVTVEHPLRQYRIQITNTDSLAIHLLQEPFHLLGLEGQLDGGLQPGEFLSLFYLDGSLLNVTVIPKH